MSIVSEKQKLATERFLLVRLNPARFILPVLNAGLYEITFPYLLNEIQLSGVVLTKVVGTPVSDGEWSQNETTLLTQIKLSVVPDSTTNILVAFYYLFYTGTIFRSISEDPEDPMTTIRNWEPRIQNYPTVIQSFTNILQGIFSINDTSIVLINENRNFQQYLTDDDSFFNKTVDIWLCITDVTNIKKIFTGTVKQIQFDQNTVQIKCADSFNRLKQKAFMGDVSDDCYASLVNYPSLDPKQKDKPIPYIVGEYSRYTTITETEPTSGFPLIYKINGGNDAFCTSFELPATTSNNRNWIACRQSNAISLQNFGAISDFVNLGSGYGFVNFASLANVHVGDTIKYTTLGTDYYGFITYIGNFSYLANPYNCIVSIPSGNFTLGSTITNLPSFGLASFDAATNETDTLIYERDYTIDDTQVTSGGNRLVKINLNVNFEANLSLAFPLDANKNRLYYRTSNTVFETHSEILEKFLTFVGLPIETTSFSAADVDLDANAMFSIPNYDEQDFQDYLKYAQDVLKSTLGFLKVNSDFEIEYYILKSPTSTDVRDSFLMLADSTNCDVQYQDILNTLIMYNPHNSSDYETSKTSTPSETRTDLKSRWLNETNNSFKFRHCLQTITDRVASHIGINAMRSVTYLFKTATQDIDSELGQDLELQNKIVLGNSQIQDVKITTIEKSPSKVSIEASDLKGI